MRHLNNITRLMVLACVFLAGCQKDEEIGTPKTILTLQVDAGTSLVGDNWIFATDATGEVLGVEQYAPGKTVTFTSAKAVDKITVNFFQYSEQQVETTMQRYTWISSYADVPAGTALHIEADRTDLPPWSKATFSLTDVDNGDIGFTNGSVADPSYVLSNGTLDVDLSFFGSPSDVLMTGYRAGVPVYNWATGVKDGDKITRDYETDFTPFQHQITLDFDGITSAYVLAQNARGKNYSLIRNPNETPGVKPVIGYVDGFDSYRTTIRNAQTNGVVTYEKSGTFNLSPTIPAFTFSKISDDFQDYAFNFSQDYTYYAVAWGYSDGADYFSWNKTALAGTTVKQLSIPKEIAAKYPTPDASKFKFYGVGFTKVLQGDLFLQSMPGMPELSGPYESYTYWPAP